MPCEYCEREFDPIATRWLCPHCHMKANCCNGAPLPERAIADDRRPERHRARTV